MKKKGNKKKKRAKAALAVLGLMIPSLFGMLAITGMPMLLALALPLFVRELSLLTAGGIVAGAVLASILAAKFLGLFFALLPL